MRKIYIVPNLVTTANMFCGYYSIVASINGNIRDAAFAIIGAAVFDMLDGRIARMAKATSAFGVEYDSLSDLLSFGIAPSILLHQWSLSQFGRLGWLASFLFVTCAALRLARFNVTAETVPKGFFQGMPTPVAAGIISTFVIFYFKMEIPLNTMLKDQLILGFTLGLSTLMVSSVPFPSFKEFNWRSRASQGYFLVGILVMILIAAEPEIALFGTAATYFVLSLLWNIFRVARGKPLVAQTREIQK
jgi:CDP-diacylglycerol--serine O-phosphatidyltransferase